MRIAATIEHIGGRGISLGAPTPGTAPREDTKEVAMKLRKATPHTTAADHLHNPPRLYIDASHKHYQKEDNSQRIENSQYYVTSVMPSPLCVWRACVSITVQYHTRTVSLHYIHMAMYVSVSVHQYILAQSQQYISPSHPAIQSNETLSRKPTGCTRRTYTGNYRENISRVYILSSSLVPHLKRLRCLGSG